MCGLPAAPTLFVTVRCPALAPITVWKRPETSLPAAKAHLSLKSFFAGRFPSLLLHTSTVQHPQARWENHGQVQRHAANHKPELVLLTVAR